MCHCGHFPLTSLVDSAAVARKPHTSNAKGKATGGAARSRQKERTAPPRAKRTKRPVELLEPEADAPDALTPIQFEFCLVYLSNGYKAGPAYAATHPNCKSDNAARVQGHRILTNANVRAHLAKQLGGRWAQLEITADEAAALVGGAATADVRLLFDEKGALLPVHQWPDEIALQVEAVDTTRGTVRLASKLGARRMILEVSGRLRGNASDLRDLAEILAEGYDKRRAKQAEG